MLVETSKQTLCTGEYLLRFLEIDVCVYSIILDEIKLQNYSMYAILLLRYILVQYRYTGTLRTYGMINEWYDGMSLVPRPSRGRYFVIFIYLLVIGFNAETNPAECVSLAEFFTIRAHTYLSLQFGGITSLESFLGRSYDP